MVDMFSVKLRSEIMSKVKSRGNKATELRLIEIFREFKISGWRRRAKVFGNPDFVFHSARVAVFVDGCFWHCCPIHGGIPATNRKFWAAKLDRNKNRDKVVKQKLRAAGWRILRIWQHELSQPSRVARRVNGALIRSSQRSAQKDNNP